MVFCDNSRTLRGMQDFPWLGVSQHNACMAGEHTPALFVSKAVVCCASHENLQGWNRHQQLGALALLYQLCMTWAPGGICQTLLLDQPTNRPECTN
jgi:hypothetical protein